MKYWLSVVMAGCHTVGHCACCFSASMLFCFVFCFFLGGRVALVGQCRDDSLYRRCIGAVDLENKSRSRLMDAPTTVVRSKCIAPCVLRVRK